MGPRALPQQLDIKKEEENQIGYHKIVKI